MKRYKIVITETAKSDLKQAARYITVELSNANAARKLVRDVKAEIKKLASTPSRHELAADPYLAHLGIRKIYVGNYVILYIVSDETKTVAVVRFGLIRRNWKELL